MARPREGGTPRKPYSSTDSSAEEFESSRSNASSTALQLPEIGTSEHDITLNYYATEHSFDQERLEGSSLVDRWLCQFTGAGVNAPSVPASVVEFYDKSYHYLQQSYFYKMIEHVSPGSATLWTQTQVQDAASLHGLYAAGSAVAVRLAPDNGAKTKLRTIAREYYTRSLMIMQVRIQNGENLERIAYDTASLLVYTSALNDWPSYRVHLDGMRHIVMLLGGVGPVNLAVRLLLLVGESQAASHMLTRSTSRPLEWGTPSWHANPDLAEARHLFKIDNVQRHALAPGGIIQPSVDRLLKEIQDFHSILTQCCMSENALNTMDNARRWLTMKFFALTQRIVNVYCDSSQNKLFRTQNDFINSIEGLERAFLVALLCYHQCVYYAKTNPSLLSSRHVPFHHVKRHLEQFTGNPEHLKTIASPEVLEALTWISFVATYEDGLNEGDLIHGGVSGWSSNFCHQMISLQQTSIRTGNDLRNQLMKVSYCDSVFGPSLHRLWDQMHRRKGPHTY
ncbi:hypothetical protein LTR84_009694 [Exophiala bonariae]|uniref:Transcription factor domain-containing protein n=1 Tax=Exophiala bonariae TaxID=1690606 RepID=A0AAV9NJF0_9EURO|nr:hypothetical protein LTR84_009694 [Exophiala bonariae]